MICANADSGRHMLFRLSRNFFSIFNVLCAQNFSLKAYTLITHLSKIMLLIIPESLKAFMEPHLSEERAASEETKALYSIHL